ncbi:DUF4059 family protein [Streptococcus dentiloxodontae]
MLLSILKFYLLGLLIAFVLTFVLSAIWISYRAVRKKDRTIRERQSVLYDAIMMSMVAIPILAFAFMAIIIMMRA